MSVKYKPEAKHTIALREHPVSQVPFSPPRKSYLQQREARRLSTFEGLRWLKRLSG